MTAERLAPLPEPRVERRRYSLIGFTRNPLLGTKPELFSGLTAPAQ
jgi:hypothetical protein